MTDSHLTTHGHDCWSWGPKHYECAVRQAERLAEALRVARARTADLAEWLKLRVLEADMDQEDRND